jgi:hypothetical protein
MEKSGSTPDGRCGDVVYWLEHPPQYTKITIARLIRLWRSEDESSGVSENTTNTCGCDEMVAMRGLSSRA